MKAIVALGLIVSGIGGFLIGCYLVSPALCVFVGSIALLATGIGLARKLESK